jgi:RluA family pseudouridine synthase
MVLQRFKISNELSKLPLVDILALELNISKGKAKSLLDSHSVFVNGRRIWMAKAKVRPGDEVEIQRIDEAAASKQNWNAKLEIIYQDSSIIVINKPAGLESIGAKGIEGKLAAQLRVPALFACHRLDRDTTGCFVVAYSEEIAKTIEGYFRARAVNKIYLALAEGDLPERDFLIDQRIDGKEASTRFTVVSRTRHGMLLEVKPITGRTHQIRRHLQTVGARLLGEKSYLGKLKASASMRMVRRQMLHAYKLDLPTLADASKRLKFTAPLPQDFIAAADLIEVRPGDLKRFVAAPKGDKNSKSKKQPKE